MSLDQMHSFKRWHMAHHHGHSVEFAICDTVLGAWVGGWILLLPLFLLQKFEYLPASLLLVMLPDLYFQLRRWLHVRQVLRCDWLDALRADRDS